MKKVIYILIVAAAFFASCKNMDDTYAEFIVPNGLKYPQRVDSLKVYAGYNKLSLSWLKATDPSITHARVYWNNYQDSIDVEIDPSKDTVFVDVNGIGEGTFTFYVKTFDKQGNASIPTEITGTSYGVNYLIGVTDRALLSAVRDAQYNGTLTWGNKTTDLVYTEVRYKTRSGGTNTVKVPATEQTTHLTDVMPREQFEYRSVFLPPHGIDVVPTKWKKSDYPFLFKFVKTAWTASTRNGNHNWGDGGGGEPFRLFDNNKATGWHSRIGTPLPQVVVIDMKESAPIDHLVIVPPATITWRYWHRIDVYLTDTPLTAEAPNASWPEPVAKVTYNGDNEFVVNLPPNKQGRYLAFVFLDSTAAPSTYISMMEVDAYGF